MANAGIRSFPVLSKWVIFEAWPALPNSLSILTRCYMLTRTYFDVSVSSRFVNLLAMLSRVKATFVAAFLVENLNRPKIEQKMRTVKDTTFPFSMPVQPQLLFITRWYVHHVAILIRKNVRFRYNSANSSLNQRQRNWSGLNNWLVVYAKFKYAD